MNSSSSASLPFTGAEEAAADSVDEKWRRILGENENFDCIVSK